MRPYITVTGLNSGATTQVFVDAIQAVSDHDPQCSDRGCVLVLNGMNISVSETRQQVWDKIIDAVRTSPAA